jgi:hypothetical protein
MHLARSTPTLRRSLRTRALTLPTLLLPAALLGGGAGCDSSGRGGGGRGGGGGGSGILDLATGGVDPKAPDLLPPPEPVVYAHSPSKLYRLDARTKAVTLVGSFQGCTGGVIDLALDAQSRAYVTTSDSLYSLDLTTARCTLIADGNYPNSLSFVPAGTLDPNQETLVGYFGSQYVRIDTQTGQVQNVGSLTGGLNSSGDIVSVEGGGTFLTVTGNSCGDCLVQVNPATGAMIRNYGSVGRSSVYGLAYWGGSLYGFSDGGALFEVTANGNSVQTTSLSIPNQMGSLQWWGAGSTTSAPVTDADGGSIPIQ